MKVKDVIKLLLNEPMDANFVFYVKDPDNHRRFYVGKGMERLGTYNNNERFEVIWYTTAKDIKYES